MTTKHSLDNHKLKYEFTKNDPKKVVPKAVQLSSLGPKPTDKDFGKLMKPKRQGIIKTYLKCIIETIFA